MAKQPTQKTVKRLFAVSGNQCAFPRCTTPLVDDASGTVTGKICHIKARSKSGPRFDPSQSEEDRHGFSNLLLLCAVHHDVVDADEKSYSVDRLLEMKEQHEGEQTEVSEPSDDVARQFITNITRNVITNGSIVFTQNQMGGQAAHSITNIGPQPRRISKAAANALVSALRGLPPETVKITVSGTESEPYQLGQVLHEILALSGWTTGSLGQGLFTGMPVNVNVKTPVRTKALEIFVNWMGKIGLKPQAVLDESFKQIDITVGAGT